MEKITPRHIYAEEGALPPGRRKILDEVSFKEICLSGLWTTKEIKEIWGISHHTLINSRTYYYSKYAGEIKKAKHQLYSKALQGNTHGKRNQPAIIIDRNLLQSYLERDMPVYTISKKTGMSEFLVKKNITYHGLVTNKNFPARLRGLDEEYLRKLSFFAPNLMSLAESYYNNPKEYYEALYLTHLELQDLVNFIKDQAHGYDYWRNKNNYPESYICWNTQRYEVVFARALLECKIEHIRQHFFYKMYTADFYFPQKKLLVEIDGEFHRVDKKTQERDKNKELHAKRLGYIVMRFSTKDVENNLPTIIDTVIKKLAEN
jgi:very-short-patch-repair endonuclease